MVDAVLSFHPESVLEIGCNCGPNLYQIHLAAPGIRLFGIDTNHQAIAKGRDFFRTNQLPITIMAWDAKDLEDIDRRFDVIFTDATLMLIHPIDEIIQNMVKSANLGIVVLEYNDEAHTLDDTYIYRKGYWKRNYKLLFSQFDRVRSVDIQYLTKRDWNDKYWLKLGAMTIVRLREVKK